MSDTAANKQVVEQFWSALSARDWDGLAALLTDDAHYNDVGGWDAGATGPAAIVARLKIGLEPLSGYVHLPGAVMVAEGDIVVTEHRERWDFGGGTTVDHPFASVTELRDGRICRWHDYSNLPNILDNAPQWWREHIMTAWAETAQRRG